VPASANDRQADAQERIAVALEQIAASLASLPAPVVNAPVTVNVPAAPPASISVSTGPVSLDEGLVLRIEAAVAGLQPALRATAAVALMQVRRRAVATGIGTQAELERITAAAAKLIADAAGADH